MERNLKKLKQLKRLLAVVLCFLLTIGLLPSSALADGGNDASSGTEQTNYAFPTTLQYPVTVTDPTMTSGQSVTWDYVWFGSYPQSEVESMDSVLYSQLQAASGWDSNNDITLDGTKYRRMKKDDATHTKSGSNNYYNWSDDATYHYFKYEPIKWRVLEVSGERALLLADIALDDQCYNTNLKSVTWETSSVRSWLNGYGASSNQPKTDYTSKNFINCAFTQKEKDAILMTTLKNENNLGKGTNGGNHTNDKVFLLSESDVYTDSAMLHGFVSSKDTKDEARRCKSSTYAKAMGVYSSTEQGYEGNCYWWLRSPGNFTRYAAYVYDYGHVYSSGFRVSYSISGVRPALYLKLSSLIYLSNNSTDESWKLTMTDSTKTVALNTTAEVSRQGNVVTVPYTYSKSSDSSNINQISVMITDKKYGEANAKIGYYGVLQNTTTVGESGTGTGTFTLPEAYANQTCGEDYYVYIMAENVNENTENYASNPVSISVPDSKTSTTTTLSHNCGSTITYGDSYVFTAQTTAGSANVDGAEVVYYTDENCTTGRTTTKPTNAGTYYVRGEYVGNETYIASNSAVFKLEIKKKEVTATWQNIEFTYNGTEKAVTATLDGVLEDDKSNVTLAYTNDTTYKNKATNVGSYEAKASLSGSAAENYALQGADKDGNISTTWEITQADISNDVTLDASGMDKDYDGKVADVSKAEFDGYPEIDAEKTVEYYTADGQTKLENAPIDAGTYTIKMTVSDFDGNYKPVEKTDTYIIAKKKVTANVIAKDKVYDGNKDAKVSATAETGIEGEALAITGLTGTFDDANAGTDKNVTIDSSKAVVTVAEGNDKTNAANYDVSYPETATANIAKANMSDEIEVDADSLNKAYDGKSVKNPSVTRPAGAAVTYEYYKVNEEAGTEEKLTSAPKDAGTYKVRVSVTKSNYNDVIVEKDFTIEKSSEVESPDTDTVKAVAETIKGKKDGQITGLDDTMEYSEDGGKTYNVIPKGTTELTNLPAGTYFVRYKETANYKASDAIEVTVEQGVPAVATKVKLNATSAMLTGIGKTKQLKATATPSNAVDKEIIWTSSNPNVATVDANGKVTAVGNGTATITATVKNGTAKATCKVKVNTSTEKTKTQLTLSKKLKALPSGNNVKVRWGKVSGADGYYVYAQYCGSDFTTTPTATIKGNEITSVTIKKINKKAIDKTKVYKFYVAAYKTVNGKNIVIGKSICAHIAGANNKKYTNPNKVTTTKSSYSLKAGKTAQIKASQTLVNAKKKALTDSHATTFRYASSDKSVATVNWTTGKITAVAKGTCKVYVYARNGYTKTISVTVK